MGGGEGRGGGRGGWNGRGGEGEGWGYGGEGRGKKQRLLTSFLYVSFLGDPVSADCTDALPCIGELGSRESSGFSAIAKLNHVIVGRAKLVRILTNTSVY